MEAFSCHRSLLFHKAVSELAEVQIFTDWRTRQTITGTRVVECVALSSGYVQTALIVGLCCVFEVIKDEAAFLQ